MTSTWRSLAVTAVIAAVAGGAATWASASWLQNGRSEPTLHATIHSQLDLTPEQEQRIDAIEADFADERAGLEAELRAANRELVTAISANQGDTPEVQAAVDHFHVAMGDLQKATLRHIFEMRAVLTPEQAADFDAAVVESLQASSG